VPELRWLLLAAGILILALTFWISRREASGKPLVPPGVLRRRLPGLGEIARTENAPAVASPNPTQASTSPEVPARIIAIRLTGIGRASFAGEALILALRETGLRHGRFGIFHRHDPENEQRIRFSVASLVEPGSFDLTRIRSERFPGVSLFMAVPSGPDGVAAFDDMLSTARALAVALDGELLDENGSRLSVQRERYLREEIIQYRHKMASS